jgi:polyhydroxybutyrate depolymerase
MKVKVRIIPVVLIFSVIAILFYPVIATAGEGCKDLTGESGEFYRTIQSNGWEREYVFYVPPKYKSNSPTPLVFNFHGLFGNPDQQIEIAGMFELADKYKFILAFPLGLGPEIGGPTSWNGGLCCGPAVVAGIDDVTFVSDMIDEISSEYCINPKRIFATGYSNGGFMSLRLACDLSDKIAAVATVAGMDVPTPCEQSRLVPILAIHGTDDFVVPYEGGTNFPQLPVFPNVPEKIVEWADRNGCSDETTVTYQKGDVTCVTYDECEDDASVTLCTVQPGGHTWPGSDYPFGPLQGYTTQDINASRAIWKFFAAHPMFDDEDDDDD